MCLERAARGRKPLSDVYFCFLLLELGCLALQDECESGAAWFDEAQHIKLASGAISDQERQC